MAKSYTELIGIHQGYIKMWEVLTARVTPTIVEVDHTRKGTFRNNKSITIT